MVHSYFFLLLLFYICYKWRISTKTCINTEELLYLVSGGLKCVLQSFADGEIVSQWFRVDQAPHTNKILEFNVCVILVSISLQPYTFLKRYDIRQIEHISTQPSESVGSTLSQRSQITCNEKGHIFLTPESRSDSNQELYAMVRQSWCGFMQQRNSNCPFLIGALSLLRPSWLNMRFTL